MPILFDFLMPTPADSFDERPGPSRWAELMNLTRAAGPPASVEWLPAEIKRRTLFELYSKPSPALAHLAPSPPWPEPLSSQSSNLREMTSRQATDSWEGVNSPLKQSNSLPGLSDTIPFARRYLRTMNSGLGSIAATSCRTRDYFGMEDRLITCGHQVNRRRLRAGKPALL